MDIDDMWDDEEDIEQFTIRGLEKPASPASVPGGMELSEPTILPDGSGFGTLSLPLPKDHWLYAERGYEEGAIDPKDLPAPILTHALRQQVIEAIRYAVRSATNCGKEDDFDPDALVQNAVYALCGPYGAAAPAPTVSEDRKDDESTLEFISALEERLIELSGELPSQDIMHKLSAIRQRVSERKWELIRKESQAMQEDKP